jgi:hypothetical protein
MMKCIFVDWYLAHCSANKYKKVLYCHQRAVVAFFRFTNPCKTMRCAVVIHDTDSPSHIIQDDQGVRVVAPKRSQLKGIISKFNN